LGQGTSAASNIEISATLFRIAVDDGRVLTAPNLVGAILEVGDEAGRVMTVRIDIVSRRDR
jgi:hypothetical protein